MASSSAVNMGDKNDDTSTESYSKKTDEVADSTATQQEVYYSYVTGVSDDVSSRPNLDLVYYLPTGWSNNTRKRSKFLPETYEILGEVKDALVLQFESLVEAQKGSDLKLDEIAVVDRIRNLLVQLSQIFLQSHGVDIDETSILNILQHDLVKRRSEIEYMDVLDTQNKRAEVDDNVVSRILQEAHEDNVVSRILQEAHEKKKGLSIEDLNNDQMGVIRKAKNLSGLIESKGSLYECKVCKQIFTDYRALGGHMASHNRNNMSELNEYQCDICKEVFDDFRALGGHKASHNRKKRVYETAFGGSNLVEEKSYKCNICGKRFSSGQALGGHKTFHRKFADTDHFDVGVEESCKQVTLFSAQNPQEEQWGAFLTLS